MGPQAAPPSSVRQMLRSYTNASHTNADTTQKTERTTSVAQGQMTKRSRDQVRGPSSVSSEASSNAPVVSKRKPEANKPEAKKPTWNDFLEKKSSIPFDKVLETQFVAKKVRNLLSDVNTYLFDGGDIEEMMNEADERTQEEREKSLIDAGYCDLNYKTILIDYIKREILADSSFVYRHETHMAAAEKIGNSVFILVFMRFMVEVLGCDPKYVVELFDHY